MYLRWIAGLILIALAAIYIIRNMREAARARAGEEILRRERQRLTDVVTEQGEGIEDTAPAVLTPPEWTKPKGSASGIRRR